jgi:hypothetical protein
MSKLYAGLLLLTLAGCGMSSGNSGSTVTTVAPQNKPVGAQPPSNDSTATLKQPFGESQGIGISPDH